uniref:Uncharacterized protein n=1 Tax=viral metagenome TaxID=1070528 RepID=A0A6C0EA44_9ZZZZ
MEKENVQKESEENTIPSNFRNVIMDFTNDLSITFPEFSYLWSKWTNTDIPESEIKELFDYCIKVYPERFFDILYQNQDIYNTDSEVNTFFLPNVDFKMLFACEGISENTQKSIWKYLQLILFTIIGGIKDKSSFGDSMNLFDGIDEGDLQEKLKETMTGLTDFFSSMGMDAENTGEKTEENGDETENNMKFQEGFKNMFENMPDAEEFKKSFPFDKMGGMPNMENIQDHLKTLFEGKIGTLAKEMAEEISGEFSDLLGEDTNNITSTKDVIQKLMKNPKKIMDLMKTVSSKLDNKMKSGEISREEIMKEAGDLIGKMKDMGGQDQFTEMFKNLAKNMGMGKNMKLDTNALDRMTKQQSMRERMRSKLEMKKQKQAEELEKMKERTRQQMENATKFSLESNSENSFVFRLDGQEAQQKSYKSRADMMADMLIAEEEAEKSKAAAESTQTKKKKKKTKK